MWLDAIFLKYRTIFSEGTPFPQRASTNFIGCTVEDDPTNDRTNVTADGSGSAGITVADEGVTLPTLCTTMTFTGDGVTASGAGANKTINIPASFTPPSGTGIVTVTSSVIDDAALNVGTGVASWISVPSSANLAFAVTDETGSGSLVFGTAPLFKTTVNLNNPGNTFKYVITPAAIGADRTITLPLLAGNDTLVTEAFTQTLTNKTIAGASNTLSVRIANDVTGLGTGVATFLATPSSANLASALTDETGSGAAVFGTSPTFTTTFKLNNPANTFAYTFTSAAIVAARNITLPLLAGDDTLVTAAFAQTLTNKTIAAGSNTITGLTPTSLAASSTPGALAIDWATANVFTKTLSSGANTFTFSNATDGQTIMVVVTGASSTLTWPTVKWAAGTVPTQTASGIDVYTFVKAGSTVYGSVVQAMA